MTEVVEVVATSVPVVQIVATPVPVVQIVAPELRVVEVVAAPVPVVQVIAPASRVVEVVRAVGPVGPQGLIGPRGLNGGDVGTVAYVHHEPTPQQTWTITHPLEFFPSITVVDSAGSVVEGDVTYPSMSTVMVTFSGAFSGTAYLS
jgi:hypothetical protein